MDKRKIPYLKIIPVLFLAFILYKFVDNTGALVKGISYIRSLLLPFIWAFATAYFLNPLMRYFENKFKVKRWFSLILVYAIFIGVITFGIIIIAPRIVDNMVQLVKEIPNYVDKTKEFVDDLTLKLQSYNSFGLSTDIMNNLDKIIINAGKYADVGLNIAVTKLINFTSGLFKLIIGILISVYMLKDKEKIILGIKRLTYAIFKERGDKIIDFARESDVIFSKFIIGKFIDSFIIGVICFIGLSILKSPFTILISLTVGVTNMIPYFGPFIGMIAGALLVLFYNPIMALWVLIFLFFLQQFDGWYLGPKILGDMVGLNPLWIILAVIVGGGLFGVVGMFLGVPVIAIMKLWMDRFVDRRLENFPVDKKVEEVNNN